MTEDGRKEKKSEETRKRSRKGERWKHEVEEIGKGREIKGEKNKKSLSERKESWEGAIFQNSIVIFHTQISTITGKFIALLQVWKVCGDAVRSQVQCWVEAH